MAKVQRVPCKAGTKGCEVAGAAAAAAAGGGA